MKQFQRQNKFSVNILTTCHKQSYCKSCIRTYNKKIGLFSIQMLFLLSKQAHKLHCTTTKRRKYVKLTTLFWPMGSILTLGIVLESRCKGKMNTWTSLTFILSPKNSLKKYCPRTFQQCYILCTIKKCHQFWSIIHMKLELSYFKYQTMNLLSTWQKSTVQDNWYRQFYPHKIGKILKMISR